MDRIEIRENVTKVIKFICEKAEGNQYDALKEASKRLDAANIEIVRKNDEYLKAREALMKAELELSNSLHNLTVVYMNDIPKAIEQTVVILLSPKSPL